MMHVLSNIALVIACLGALTFVVIYQLLADWRSSALGRNVMAFMGVCGILLLLAVLRNFVPWIDDHRDGLRLVCFSAVSVIIWWRVWLLIRAQRGSGQTVRGYRESSTHSDRGGDA